MNKMRIRAICYLLGAVVLLLPTALAAAKGLGALTIRGPGIQGELKLDDAKEMEKLDRSGFFELGRKVEAPQGLGDGYAITRHLHMEEGLIPWDKLVYYPDPAGGQAYLYYEGSLDKNHQGFASTGWYRVRSGTEQVFHGILAAHGVAIAVSAPAPSGSVAGQPPVEAKANAIAEPAAESVAAVPAAPAAETVRVGTPETGFVLGIGVLIALVAAWAVLRRRQPSEPVAGDR